MTSLNGLRREFINTPFLVQWLGFEGDTFTLQRFGWELHVQADMARMAYTFILRHRDARAMGMFTMEAQEFMQSNPGTRVPVRVNCELVKDLYVQSAGFRGLRFQQVGQPYHASDDVMAERHVPIDHLHLFSTPIAKPENDIIVTPEAIPDLLSQIREAQVPNQEKLLKSLSRHEVEVQTNTNVIALVS